MKVDKEDNYIFKKKLTKRIYRVFKYTFQDVDKKKVGYIPLINFNNIPIFLAGSNLLRKHIVFNNRERTEFSITKYFDLVHVCV